MASPLDPPPFGRPLGEPAAPVGLTPPPLPNRDPVDYTAFTNPGLQRAFAPQAAVQRDQAQEAERLARANAVEARRQQREQAMAEKARQRDLERQAKAAADESRRRRNADLERQFRSEGRDFYSDSYGAIQPTYSDEEWQKRKTKRDAEEKERARTDPLRREISAVDALMGDPAKAPLSQAQREQLTADLRTQSRDAINTVLLPSLAQTAQEKDTGVPWWPFDNAPTSRATTAQQRQQAINQRLLTAEEAKAPVDLDDDDLADLERLDPARVQTLRSLRDRLAADDANQAWQKEQATKKFELDLRLRNPQEWEARQKARFATTTDPATLQAEADRLVSDYNTRVQDLNTRAAAFAAEDDAFDQSVKDLTAENLAAVAQGLPAEQLITLTNPATGEATPWRRDLADRLLAAQEQRQAAFAAQAPERRALQAEADAIQFDQRLADFAVTTAKARAKEARARDLDQLRSNPSFAPIADQLAALDAEGESRLQSLSTQYTQGSPEYTAALQALQTDLAARASALTQMIPAKRDAGAKLYSALLNGNPSTDWASVTDEIGRENITREGAALGLSPEESSHWIQYFQRSDFTKGNTEDPSRVLPDGSIAINPSLWLDRKKAEAAIENSPAAAEAKAAAKASLPALEDHAYAAMLPALSRLGAFREFAYEHGSQALVPGLVSYLTDEDRQAAIATGQFKSPEELVKAFRKDQGWLKSQLNQLLIGGAQAGLSIANQSAGAYAGITGDAGATEFARIAGLDASRLGQISESLPAGQWTAKITQGAGSILPALAGGMLAGTVGRLLLAGRLAQGKLTLDAANSLATRIGLGGSAGAAGLQSFGATYSDAYSTYLNEGMDADTARTEALKPALASGLTTTLITYAGGATGVESLFATAAARQSAANAITGFLKGMLKGAASEFPEEAIDQFAQGLIAQATYQPNKSIRQIVDESLEAGAIGAVLGGAMGGVQGFDQAINPQQPPPPARAGVTPEQLAAARTQIDRYAPPGLTPEQVSATRRTASALFEVAQGNIAGLTDDQLALLDIKRTAKGELENLPTQNGRPVRVKVENGNPIITQPTLDKLATEMPAVRALIGMDEAAARSHFTAAAAATAGGAGGSGGGTASAASTPSSNTVPAQTASPAPSATTSVPSSNPATNPPTNPAANSRPDPARALSPEESTRVQELTDFLTSRDVTPEHAVEFSEAYVRTEGVTDPDFAIQGARMVRWMNSLGGGVKARAANNNVAITALRNYLSVGQPSASAPASSSSATAPAPSPSSTPGQPAPGPAPAARLTDLPEYSESRRDAIASLTAADPVSTGKLRKSAVKALDLLDQTLGKYGSLFPGGARLADSNRPSDQELIGSGGGLWVDPAGGNITLVVHLPTFLQSYAASADGKAIRAVTEEELIHRVTLSKFNSTELAAFWSRLPAAIQNRVWAGYHAVAIADGDLPARPPSTLTTLQKSSLAHEFLRMLVQDRAFRGRVTESQDIDPALKQEIIQFLRTLVKGLRDLISRAPKEIQAEIAAYEKATIDALNDLLRTTQTAPAQPASRSGTVQLSPADLAATTPSPLAQPGTATAPPSSPSPPNLVLGSSGTAYTDTNVPIEYTWAVADVAELTVSNDDAGRINPAYPTELQPRDRTSAGSEAQVQDIATNTNLDRLSTSNSVSDGAPIIGEDGVVESGNGRLMGLRRAYARTLENVSTYRDALISRAAEFGLDPAAISRLQNPVLVRVRTTPLTTEQRVAFGQAANVSTVAPMREAEVAKKDASNLTPELLSLFNPDAEDSNLLSSQNADFIRAFVRDVVPPAERPALIDASGTLSQSGLRRVRNALFVAAYGDSPAGMAALSRLAESTDDAGRNLVSALTAAAPTFAEQKARMTQGTLHLSLDLTEDVLAAVSRLQDLKAQGMSVADFLAQDQIPGIGDDMPVVQRAILQFLDAHTRSPRKLREGFARYQSAVEGVGNPQQASLFGDSPADKAALWNLAATYTPALSAGRRRLATTPGDMNEQSAAQVYKRLFALQQQGTALNRGQQDLFSRAEAVLGQRFLFDQDNQPSYAPPENLVLESETDTPTQAARPEQLTLFAGAKRLNAPPVKLDYFPGETTLPGHDPTLTKASSTAARLAALRGRIGQELSTDDRGRRPDPPAQRVSEILRGWARANGLLIRPEKLKSIVLNGRPIRGGEEHDVFLDPDTGRVIKITTGTSYGAKGISAWIHNIERANEVLEDDIEFLGVVEGREGQVKLVISQPFIDGQKASTDQIAAYFHPLGYRRVSDLSYYHPDREEQISDAKEANVYLGSDGQVYPIDVHFVNPTERQKEMFDNIINSGVFPTPAPLQSSAKRSANLRQMERFVARRQAAADRFYSHLPADFQAAVEEDGRNGYPGMPGLRPSPGLDRSGRIVEAYFAHLIAQNPRRAIARYFQLAKQDFGSERYINADLARSVLPDYQQQHWFRTAFDAATIAPAGYIAIGMAYPRLLARAKGQRTRALFLAGGPASGKTSAFKALMSDAMDHVQVIVDSVMKAEAGASWLMNQAIEKGYVPSVYFVYRPWETAFRGAVSRLITSGRPVNVPATADMHVEAQRTFLNLAEKYRQSADFHVLANDGLLEDIRVEPLAFLRERAYYLTDGTAENLARRYGDYLASEHDRGRLTAPQYAAARWGSPDLANYRASQGADAQSESRRETGAPPEGPLSAPAKRTRSLPSIVRNGTAREALTAISRSRSKYSALAEQLLSIPSSGLDVKFNDSAALAAASLSQDRSHYLGTTPPLIWIADKDVSDHRVILHEIVHAMTMPALRKAFPNEDGGAQYRKLLEEQAKQDTPIGKLSALYLEAVRKLGQESLFESRTGGETLVFGELTDVYGPPIVAFKFYGLPPKFDRIRAWMASVGVSPHDVYELGSTVAGIKERTLRQLEKKGAAQKTGEGTWSLNIRSIIPAPAGDADATLKAGAPYGLGNLAEFLTEAFTKREFQKLLNRIPSDRGGQTLWQRFVDAISSILGIPVKSNSLLDEVLREGVQLMHDPLFTDGVTSSLSSPRKRLQADGSPFGSPGWRAAHTQLLAHLPAKGRERAKATQALKLLHQTLTRYAGLFPAGVRLADASSLLDHEYSASARPMWPSAYSANPALVIDLGNFLRSYGGRPSASAIRAAVEEEVIHTAAMSALTPNVLAAFWDRLPINLQTRVWRSYYVNGILEGSIAADPDATELDASEKANLAHEFLRIVIQDKAFRGRVTESTSAQGWNLPRQVTQYLAQLARRLRAMIREAPPEVRREIAAYERVVTNALQDLAQRRRPARDAESYAVLPLGSGRRRSIFSDPQMELGGEFSDLFNLEGQRLPTATSPAEPPSPPAPPPPRPDRETPPANPAQGPITDFGEVIHGSRKELWGEAARALHRALPEDVREITLAQHFPEPSYDRLIKEGVPVDDLATFRALRDMIPPKPGRSWKLNRWVDLVRAMREAAASILQNTATSRARMDEVIARYPDARDRVTFYRALGYPAFTKAKLWAVDGGEFSLFNGERFSTPIYRAYATFKGRLQSDLISTEPGLLGKQEVTDLVRARLNQAPSAPTPAQAQNSAEQFGLYQDRRTSEYFIGRKGANGVVRLKTGFTSAREARDYRQENATALEELWQEMRAQPVLRRSINELRLGPDRRDTDVSPQMFHDTFGFRGVQFGNWVEGGRRQKDLNDAYDALMDLAETLGIPPRALSLDGSLGLAFGARGSGGREPASAHYEPDEVVINLTKKAGPGSLAHEWWHAVDNYFARYNATGSTTATAHSRFASSDFSAPRHMRPAVWDAFSKIRRTLTQGSFAERSQRLDDARSQPYYGTTIEKSARAFERYVVDRLANSSISNDYLVNIDKEKSPAYPTPKEMEEGIRAAYDELFNTLDTRTTPTGIALFSASKRSSVDPAAHEAATSPANRLPQPTEAQKKAGNYQKGHVRLGGLDVSIENPEGSQRSGRDQNGRPWAITLQDHYGYIRGTEGKDGDHVDVFIRPGTPPDYDGPVFVVNQVSPSSGRFDEHKVIVGALTESEARAQYLRNYAPNWQGLGSIVPMSWAAFRQWIDTGDHTRPAPVPPLATPGRAQPVSSLIRTPDGPRPIGHLQPGESLLAPDGSTQYVAAVHPQGTRPVYQVTLTNGVTERFTEDHLFVVKLDSPSSPSLSMRLTDIANAMQSGRQVFVPTVSTH